MEIHQVAEGLQELRRGEGITWSVDTTNWAATPDPDPIVITRQRDSAVVTDDFITTATATVSGNEVVLPKITVPADARLGLYRVDVPFTAGDFDPGRPYIEFVVKP